jgi:Tfp pilus assembly protein PilF
MATSKTGRRGSRSATNGIRTTWTQRLNQSRGPLLLAVFLIVATLLVYAQASQFGFVLIDDPIDVSQNPHVQSGLSLQNVIWSFTAFHDGNWMPFNWLSLMLDTTVYGFRSGGYHITNVLLHVANTVLLFAFLVRATGNELRSAFVAALFGLHPLHVESVAWIAERKDVLSTLFGLMALLAYLNYATRGRRWSFAACFLCFVCSLLAKQTLVTLPFVFLLLDFWPFARLRLPFLRAILLNDESDRTRAGRAAHAAPVRSLAWLIAEKVPFLVASAAFCVVAVMAQAPSQAARAFTTLPLTIRCANAVVAYVAYLGKTFLPINLAVYYPHPGTEVSWPTVCVAATLLAAISAAAIVSVRRYPFVFVGWAWYLGTLVPMIGIVQVGGQQMADRYTYFPLIGLFVALVWLISELIPAGALRARIAPTAAIASLAILTATTYVQVGYWRDDQTLFEHALESARDNSFSRNKLGCALVQQGRLTEAIQQFETAARLDPHAIDPQFNLGLVLQNLGRLDAAADHYRAVLATSERHAHAHNNLGAILFDRGQFAEAKKHFVRALEISPHFVEANINLGSLSLKMGDYSDAITYSQRALDQNPRLIDCRRTLAQALLARGRLEDAIAQLQYLLTLSPNDQEARTELARALAKRHVP